MLGLLLWIPLTSMHMQVHMPMRLGLRMYMCSYKGQNPWHTVYKFETYIWKSNAGGRQIWKKVESI